jgi:peroxiredoxin Q/BCP
MTILDEGDVAPLFSLPDQDGTIVRLQDYLGRRAVIYFYPADDTPACTKEARQFSDFVEDYAALDAEVLGISPDDGAKHKKFQAKHGLRIVLLSDPEREVMALYGAWGTKNIYGHEIVGVIRSTFVVGKDGRIERAWYNVRADGHAVKVLEALARDT